MMGKLTVGVASSQSECSWSCDLGVFQNTGIVIAFAPSGQSTGGLSLPVCLCFIVYCRWFFGIKNPRLVKASRRGFRDVVGCAGYCVYRAGLLVFAAVAETGKQVGGVDLKRIANLDKDAQLRVALTMLDSIDCVVVRLAHARQRAHRKLLLLALVLDALTQSHHVIVVFHV